MDLSIYPVFDRELGGDHAVPRAEVLADLLEEVEDFADDADLSCPSDFADSREVPEDFSGTAEQLDELLGPSEDWFDAEKGARALEKLAERIDSEATFDGSVEVVSELRELVRALRRAATAGARFRLEIG